jgi:hypothetical protein
MIPVAMTSADPQVVFGSRLVKGAERVDLQCQHSPTGNTIEPVIDRWQLDMACQNIDHILTQRHSGPSSPGCEFGMNFVGYISKMHIHGHGNYGSASLPSDGLRRRKMRTWQG